MSQKAPYSCGSCTAFCMNGLRLCKEKIEINGEEVEREVFIKCPNAGEVRGKDVTGIPSLYYDADYSKFNFNTYSTPITGIKKITDSFFREYKTWGDKGKGLYLWSETPGSGKTMLSCCLAKSIMVKYDLQMRFVTVPDYLSLVAESYKRDKGKEDKSEVYRNCSLLVFDDIGTQKEGSWQEQELFRIINQRTQNGLITVYTSNSSPEELHIGSRTIDRIIKSSVVIRMPEESIRRKQANPAYLLSVSLCQYRAYRRPGGDASGNECD